MRRLVGDEDFVRVEVFYDRDARLEYLLYRESGAAGPLFDLRETATKAMQEEPNAQ
jgi:hypothetical protein